MAVASSRSLAAEAGFLRHLHHVRAEGTGQPLIRRVAVFADSLGLEEPERLHVDARAGDQVRFAGELLASMASAVAAQHAQADQDQVRGSRGSWSTER